MSVFKGLFAFKIYFFYGPVQPFEGWSPKYKWQRRFYQQWCLIGHMVVGS